MKFLLNASCLCFSALLLLAGCKKGEEKNTAIRVMSYNIKFDNKADTVNGWSQRRQRLANLVAFYKPDVMGTQEGLYHQLSYLGRQLRSMKWIGVGREDGKKKGEYSAIFYNTKRFNLIAHSDSTIWLSKTPEKPGKGWDASYIRILTWGKFKDTQTKKTVCIFNTHLDNDGTTARRQSARLIIKVIKEVAGDDPIILTGDFNSTQSKAPHQIITGEPSNLKDAYLVSKQPPVGPSFSYDGFNTLGSVTPRRIDYIFVNRETEVLNYAAISNFKHGRYPSDHLPVIADIKLNN